MLLHLVPIEHHFTFKGFPNEVCKVLGKSHEAVKVQELKEVSWYDHLRDVEYPITVEKIKNFELFLLNSKV